MKQLNVRLDDETHALLVAQAEANLRSANAQITWLIREAGTQETEETQP